MGMGREKPILYILIALPLLRPAAPRKKYNPRSEVFFFFTDVLGGWAGGDNDVYILYFTKPDASVACMAATLLSPDINSITSDRGGPKTDLMYPRILVSPSYTWTYNAAFFLSPGPCRVIIFTEEIIIPRHRLMLTSSL